MVDRITPVTTDEDRATIASGSASTTAGRWSASRSPSGCCEDDFTAGRPPFEDVGVQVVPDVEPYELMKLRLLNASHQALCYLGYLAGYRLVHEVAQDPLFAGSCSPTWTVEATPTLAPVPGIDLAAYRTTLIERFSNPGVRDTVARICARELRPDPEVAAAGDPGATWPPAATSPGPPPSSRAGPATPRASTSRATRSTWSTS